MNDNNNLPVLDNRKSAEYIQNRILQEHHELIDIELIGIILDYEIDYMEKIGIIIRTDKTDKK